MQVWFPRSLSLQRSGKFTVLEPRLQWSAHLYDARVFICGMSGRRKLGRDAGREMALRLESRSTIYSRKKLPEGPSRRPTRPPWPPQLSLPAALRTLSSRFPADFCGRFSSLSEILGTRGGPAPGWGRAASSQTFEWWRSSFELLLRKIRPLSWKVRNDLWNNCASLLLQRLWIFHCILDPGDIPLPGAKMYFVPCFLQKSIYVHWQASCWRKRNSRRIVGRFHKLEPSGLWFVKRVPLSSIN